MAIRVRHRAGLVAYARLGLHAQAREVCQPAGPRGKWDIEEVLDNAAWDADGVMALQALFTKIFQESSVIAQRTANNLPLEVHEELTFLAQFRIIQRSWPAWAQELARSSPQLFVSLPALWAVLQQHEPRPALASTAPAAPVPSLPALGGATDDRAILLAACAELQEGNVAPLMALLSKDGNPIKCWRCGGNHFKGDCCHPASAEELAYPGDYSKWPKPGEAGRVRVRQPPQLPPDSDHASMAEIRQELREMRREMALLRLHVSGPSAAPSTSTLMNLTVTIEARAPAAALAIFCALRGAAPPPGYIIIQEDPLHVWFAPANLGPEALEQATAAWGTTGSGGQPAAL